MAKLISAEIALGALLESLVNPTLAKMHSFGPFGALAAELDIANQMEAVAWLYNQYLCQELPDLVALDWEDLCNKASNLQTRLSKFLGVGNGLTPTQQKVKNACEAAKALRVPNNFKKITFVTKVCVCLLNFRQDKCVLALGATTMGVWSFIEKEKHGQGNKNGSLGRRQFRLADDDFAFKAVQEQTGIKADVLQIEDRFLINDDLNRAGGDTKFFIMSCMGTFDLSPSLKFERLACWISLDIVFSKARDRLIDSSGSSVHCTPAVQYFCLRPFCSSLENWLTRQQLMKSLAQITSAAEENLKNQKEIDFVMARTGASNKEKSVIIQEQSRSKPKVNEVALNMQLFAPMAEEKSEEDEQRPSKPEVNGVALNMKLFAPTGSPQSSIGRENNQTLAAGKELEECIRAELYMTNAGGIIGVEKSQFIHQAQVDNQERQSKLEVDTVGLNTNFALALKSRTEVLASRDGVTMVELPVSAMEREDFKARQIDRNTNAVALDMNGTAPERGPHSSNKIDKKEEERIFKKVGALLSYKRARRNNRKKRKGLCKELSEVNTVGLNKNFALALKSRTEVSALRDGVTMEELPASAMEPEDCKARQIDQNTNDVASDMNMTGGLYSSKKIDKKEDERILNKAGALLSFKASRRSVRRKRKGLCKELRDHMTRAYLLYKQIAEGDSHLATLMPGGNKELQLAIQLCKTDGQKQTPSLDVSIDQLQPDDALLKSSKAELQLAIQLCKTDGQKQTPSDVSLGRLQPDDALLKSSRAIGTSQTKTSYKKRPFQMLKSSMQELNEVCTRNEWPLPSYGVFSFKSKEGQCLYNGKVKIRGNDFELSESGEASETAKAAKLSAAAYMLSTLQLLKARNAML